MQSSPSPPSPSPSPSSAPASPAPPPLPIIRRIGRSIFDPIWAQQEHVDPHAELMHVLRGQVRIETPQYTMAGRAGDTLYTPSKMPHKDVFPPGSVFEVYLVQFSWSCEAAVLGQYTPQRLRIRQSQRPDLARQFDDLYREFQAEHPYYREMVSLKLMQILYGICQQVQVSTGDQPEPISHDRRAQIMMQAKQAIDRMCHEPISLDDIAAAVEVSPYYLSRVFSSESGFTLSSYLTRVRMQRAEQLLRHSAEPIKQIAQAVGYRDSHYFARVFRSHYGVPPSQFRGK